MKRVVAFLIVLSIFMSLPSLASMREYCAYPPFISTGSDIRPNLLFDIDESGSMSWAAYYATWTPIYTDQSGNYDNTTTYEGYFIPTKEYKKISVTGVTWEETNDSDSCQLVYHSSYNGGGGIYNYGNWFTISGTCSGNELNFALMARIDLLRWAITGGKPASCDGTNAGYCDPELWSESGNSKKVGAVCNDSLDVNGDGTPDGGCILLGSSGEKVKVPWSRVKDGLAFQFENFSVKPRMSVMFFSGSGVRAHKVYMGDFTAPNSTNSTYPYMNFITYLNSEDPDGATPTAPSLWDAYNYFAQNPAEYGGFTPQSGSGDEWRNPMYVCGSGGGSNCVYIPCAKNFIILMSDGQWNKGGNSGSVSTACSIDTGFENHSADPVVPAYWAHKKGFTNAATNVKSRIEDIYSIGLFLGGTGEKSLENVAMYGSFNDSSKTWPDGLSGYPQDNCYMNDCGNGKGSSCTSLPASSPDWDKNGDGIPDTFQNASTASQIKDSIKNAVLDILKQASSGTAASILATQGKSGAIMLQALFYPSQSFDNNTKTTWAGSLKSLWFYLGPFAQNIREDSVEDKVLNLFNDYAISFFFDNATNTTMVHVEQDTDGDGNPDTSMPDEKLSEVKYLWDAGNVLWQTLPSQRKIFTVDNLSGDTTEVNFAKENASKLQNYLDADNKTQAENIINYIRGNDNISGVRNRTVTIGSDSHVWKLGDIIYSTPKIVASVPLNTYWEDYYDSSYYNFNYDSNGNSKHANRGMVFVGANDGMLHAFRLGKITMLNGGSNIAKLEKQPADVELGSEAWGFIPKNLLPYLKYYMNPKYDSCHLYYVDLAPYLFDASIGTPDESDYYSQTKTENSWRTILIGGLNFGGACGNDNSSAVGPPNDSKKVPEGIGRSSYFALDVTDPEQPTVLWEFADNNSAFTTTGPAIVHIPSKKQDGTDDNTKNGYWYVVFASGPDNYDGTVHQPLYLYVLDLKTGKLEKKIQLSGPGGSPLGDIGNAFAGRMFESSVDLGTNYSNDGLYFGYTDKKVKNNGESYWDGGVIRVETHDDPIVAHWDVSNLIKDIGPVTASVKTIEDSKNNLWVYFGEGRYFTKEDDPSAQRVIYGVKDPCYSNGTLVKNCTVLKKSDLTDATTTDENIDPSTIAHGWYINLDSSTGSYNTERMITDPVATANGWVFYTTFTPTNDICGFGGYSYMRMVNYDNGGTPQNAEGSLYIQLSTGAIIKIDLKQFGSGGGGGPKPIPIGPGAPPPNQGMTLILPPPPVNKIIHWEEK